jgi:hypothetical protein
MAISGEQVKLLAAGLHGGNGHRTLAEQQDLLMQAAPDNLLDALTKSLSVREDIRVRASILARPRTWKTANWFVQRCGFLASKEEEKVRGLRAVAGGKQLFRVPSNDAFPLGIDIHVIGRVIMDGPGKIRFFPEHDKRLLQRFPCLEVDNVCLGLFDSGCDRVSLVRRAIERCVNDSQVALDGRRLGKGGVGHDAFDVGICFPAGWMTMLRC